MKTAAQMIAYYKDAASIGMLNEVMWQFSPDNSLIKDETNWEFVDIEWSINDQALYDLFSS